MAREFSGPCDARSLHMGVYSAWLSKTKKSSSFSKLLSKSNKRFFTIDFDAQTLVYRHKESDKTTSPPLRFAEIIGSEMCGVKSFTVRTGSKDLELSTTTPQDAQIWVNALKAAAVIGSGQKRQEGEAPAGPDWSTASSSDGASTRATSRASSGSSTEDRTASPDSSGFAAVSRAELPRHLRYGGPEASAAEPVPAKPELAPWAPSVIQRSGPAPAWDMFPQSPPRGRQLGAVGITGAQERDDSPAPEIEVENSGRAPRPKPVDAFQSLDALEELAGPAATPTPQPAPPAPGTLQAKFHEARLLVTRPAARKTPAERVLGRPANAVRASEEEEEDDVNMSATARALAQREAALAPESKQPHKVWLAAAEAATPEPSPAPVNEREQPQLQPAVAAAQAAALAPPAVAQQARAKVVAARKGTAASPQDSMDMDAAWDSDEEQAPAPPPPPPPPPPAAALAPRPAPPVGAKPLPLEPRAPGPSGTVAAKSRKESNTKKAKVQENPVDGPQAAAEDNWDSDDESVAADIPEGPVDAAQGEAQSGWDSEDEPAPAAKPEKEVKPKKAKKQQHAKAEAPTAASAEHIPEGPVDAAAGAAHSGWDSDEEPAPAARPDQAKKQQHAEAKAPTAARADHIPEGPVDAASSGWDDDDKPSPAAKSEKEVKPKKSKKQQAKAEAPPVDACGAPTQCSSEIVRARPKQEEKQAVTKSQSGDEFDDLMADLSNTDTPPAKAVMADELVQGFHCTACDSQILKIRDGIWSGDVEYMYFRNLYPNIGKLRQKVVVKRGCEAFCCQCSWRSAEVDARLEDVADGLRWSIVQG